VSRQQTIESVKAFWNTEACGTHFIEPRRDEAEFYSAYRRFRYATEWHIPLLVPFAEAVGKKVLEIGCGNGADGVMFAKHGAAYTGVDLTEAAVDATRKHFAAAGLSGTFQIENAERLSFADASFDIIYSYGVLHHTPSPSLAIDEVFRVLKPGGRAIVMLYHKHSFNYTARILIYMRLRLLAKILGRTGRWQSDRQKLKAREMRGLRGNATATVWEIHYENFLRQGWSYLKAETFAHHCTDGPECPYAFAYSKAEAHKLFAAFEQIEMRVAHFPLRKYRLGKWIPFRVEKALASRFGWYLIVYAMKPQSARVAGDSV
jgi:ubiquinone/menaquinone biosynthesis C-methylase UbiE